MDEDGNVKRPNLVHNFFYKKINYALESIQAQNTNGTGKVRVFSPP